MNPAGERADVLRQSFLEDFLGNRLHVSSGESLSDLLTPEVALDVLEDGLLERIVVPVGRGAQLVVDAVVILHAASFMGSRPANT
jgi:hypothetical protein